MIKADLGTQTQSLNSYFNGCHHNTRQHVYITTYKLSTWKIIWLTSNVKPQEFISKIPPFSVLSMFEIYAISFNSCLSIFEL